MSPTSGSGSISAVRRRSSIRLLMCAAMLATLVDGTAAAAPGITVPGPTPGVGENAAAPGADVPVALRDDLLGPDWGESADMIFTTIGDPAGFHLMTALESDGYHWQTAATLVEAGFDADRWIGNACVSRSGRTAYVAYGPRAFINDETLMLRGAFTAKVDLATGTVQKLAVVSSLAYFSPGCGADEDAVFAAYLHDGSGSEGVRTLVTTVHADARVSSTELSGQLTSVVPYGDRVIGVIGHDVVSIEANGGSTTVASFAGVPHGLIATGQDLVLAELRDDSTVIQQLVPATPGGWARSALASGPPTEVRLVAHHSGTIFVTGNPVLEGSGGDRLRVLPLPDVLAVSTTGSLALVPSTRIAPGTPEHPSTAWAESMTIDQPGGPGTGYVWRPSAVAMYSEERFEFALLPGRHVGVAGGAASVGEFGVPSADPVTKVTGTIDPDASCAVPRNDPLTQVYQPNDTQVEWAANLAVLGELDITRPPNWKKSGLPSYSPQGYFPSIPLHGGGRVPAQVLLGIAAQESNLWQASGHALPGVTANPLIGNYYGLIRGEEEVNPWNIDFPHADCGYGVTQVTDGMRKPGHPDPDNPDDVPLSPNRQRAVAVDYAANIAAGLRILQSKWNETIDAGVIHSDADPSALENWIFAIWAYNSGFHAEEGAGDPWGVGWFNNPANPLYCPDRDFFNMSPEDATEPEKWPYTEKVIGWAAFSIETIDGPGFFPAWWVSDEDRLAAKPPVYHFCTAAIDCHPPTSATSEVATEVAPEICRHRDGGGQLDFKCWWHEPTEYNDCDLGYCGHESLEFSPGDPEPPLPAWEEYHPPNCSISAGGLPAGARIVDDVPDNVPIVRPGCLRTWSNAGSFNLVFNTAGGEPRSKIDFHQIGGGFGGHFWFAHSRGPLYEPKYGWPEYPLRVTGTWKFDDPHVGWAKVYVHMPDHGAHTQQAAYEIDHGDGTTETRYALQRTRAHEWVSLGAMRFNGKPSISLSTKTFDGIGVDDVAWDAVAIEPLPDAPDLSVVVLGDSYTSGEGASELEGDDYYVETDNNGHLAADEGRNACHRSRLAWPRQVRIDGQVSLGLRHDQLDQELDFHFLACSGAVTGDLIDEDREASYGEVPQLRKGYVNSSTDVVMLSIGGNDARFGDVMTFCILLLSCPQVTLPGDTEPMEIAIPDLIETTVRDRVGDVLDDIEARAPSSEIVLVGYPRLVPGICVAGIGLGEGSWLDDMADLLTETLDDLVAEKAAEGMNVTFADPRDEFSGHGICTIHGPGIHNAVFTKTEGDNPDLPVSAQSFHPSKDGMQYYTAAVQDVLDDLD